MENEEDDHNQDFFQTAVNILEEIQELSVTQLTQPYTPWKISAVTTCMEGFGPKKEHSPIIMKMLFTEHDSKHEGCHKIYTDESKGDDYTAFSMIAQIRVIECNINPKASIFTAELKAIEKALTFTEQENPYSDRRIVVIYSNSSIQSIDKKPLTN